jgi:putative ABC transport system permease protein
MQEELASLKDMAEPHELGNLALAAENARSTWTLVWLEQLLQDARYAFRTLRRSPGFTIVVIFTLAVSIGMSTSVFSVLNTVLLRPLSYPDGHRLAWVTTFDRQWNEEWVSAWDIRNWKEQSQSFDALASYETFGFRLKTAQGPVQIKVGFVSNDFWKVSGVRPALGRLPAEGEEDVVVLTNDLFERVLHSDPSAISKPFGEIENHPQIVVGILPKDFLFEFPMHMDHLFDDKEIDVYRPPLGYGRGRGIASVVGRLKPGASLEQAKEELVAIRTRVADKNPRQQANEMELRVMPLLEKRTGRVYQAVWILFVAVLFVLLIACANIANLLLARASVRQKEIAIRASVGAGRVRVLRQFLVESSMLVAMGCLTGILFAYASTALIVRLSAKALPRLPEASMDLRVLLFALGISVFTALLFGLTPMIALRKTHLPNSLKEAAKAASAGRGGLRARQVLVTLELAFAVLLFTGAALMVKSFLRMNAHPDWFEPENILVMKVDLQGPHYFGVGARQKAFIDEVLRRARGVAGVKSAAVVSRGEAPLEWENTTPTSFDGEPPLTTITSTTADLGTVVGMRVVKGRWFNQNERAITINESLARRDFPGDDPIGKVLEGLGPVVGVIGDLKRSKLDARPEPEVYLPFSPGNRGDLVRTSVVIHTTGQPLKLAPTLRSLVAEIDKTQPAFEIQTLEQILADSIAPRRFNLLLLGTFAAVALLLAIIGIYGVTAYSVAQRTHEIGVRITLGARANQIVGMVLRQGAVMALFGLGFGLLAAFGLTRLMRSMLYDVEPTDAATFAITALALCLTALLACGVPALRAARVDPNVALRYE